MYRIESNTTVSRISYAGTERLSIHREGKALRFEAAARYTRDSPGGKSSAKALFVQMLLPTGSFEDRIDNDPDFLTILNQPFAVELDAATLHDIRNLHGRLPFAATSPLGGATVLRGFLRPGTNGPINGHQTVAVRFEAEGPMSGALPGHADATVSGNMRMDGTAYYALDDAILRALSVTLTINAQLQENGPPASVPVRIVYRRSIRAAAGENDPYGTTKRLLRVPPATGGETAAPSVR
ncbi:MAG: hypothetical protein WCB99_03615 [Candidatus Cybelea sp.]